MATKQVEQKAAVTPPKGILAKIQYLGELLRAKEWRKEGVNAHQKYKYIKESMYKVYHGEAVAQAGLIFKYEVIDYNLTMNISDKMNLVSIVVRMQYIDPETGEREEYLSRGDGADSGDKGLYKAETGAYKYHIANNFHISEDNDPEGDDEKQKGGTSKFLSNGGFQSPEAALAAKERVLGGELASPADVEKLEKLLVEYAKIQPEKAEAFRAANPDLTKIKAVQMKAILPNISKAVGKQ
jgi:hypothetical protein